MPDLCVIPGDGIGKEVIPAAERILKAVIPGLNTENAQAGWEVFQNTGYSVPADTLQSIRECGAGLFGAVSSPAKKVPGYRSAIITMRQELNLYANIRPIKSLPNQSPGKKVNMLIVRENTQGMYSGRERIEGGTAVAERVITYEASQRIAEKALDLAIAGKRKNITIVHKANILPVSDGLFRDTVRSVLEDSNGNGNSLKIQELLVDIAALKIFSKPETFDLIITTNLFGDILSDAASYWCGGIGLAPSINLGDGLAIAEPVHGSAPDIAGTGTANPAAAILSAALLARYVWQMEAEAVRIEEAVFRYFQQFTPENQHLFRSTSQIEEAIFRNL